MMTEGWFIFSSAMRTYAKPIFKYSSLQSSFHNQEKIENAIILLNKEIHH